jgi:membrane protease YdiL (CAAX protease family)
MWNEIGQLLIALAIVAGAAFTLGVAIWVSKRHSTMRLLPKWQVWRGPWGVFEVLVVFFVVSFLIPIMIGSGMAIATRQHSGEREPGPPPSIESQAALAGTAVTEGQQPAAAAAEEIAKTINTLWIAALSLPLQLSLLIALGRLLSPGWRFISRQSVASQLLLALIAWAVLSVLVHGINVPVNVLFNMLGLERDRHPLEKLTNLSWSDSALFVFCACVAAPVVEEFVFRGVILVWAQGGRKTPAVPDIRARFRPWILVLAALLFAALSRRTGAIVFVVALIPLMSCCLYALPRKRQTVGAIVSSAMLFGAVHSTAWPSPIPLFVLGLGLGWLAARTRSILAPIVVHGLFNAISVVIVLRSS